MKRVIFEVSSRSRQPQVRRKRSINNSIFHLRAAVCRSYTLTNNSHDSDPSSVSICVNPVEHGWNGKDAVVYRRRILKPEFLSTWRLSQAATPRHHSTRVRNMKSILSSRGFFLPPTHRPINEILFTSPRVSPHFSAFIKPKTQNWSISVVFHQRHIISATECFSRPVNLPAARKLRTENKLSTEWN